MFEPIDMREDDRRDSSGRDRFLRRHRVRPARDLAPRRPFSALVAALHADDPAAIRRRIATAAFLGW